MNGYQIEHNAVDSLLKILKKSGHDQLPGSARSLIKTARYVPLAEKSGMQYIYFPVKEELMRQFLRYPTMMKESVTTLEISLNIPSQNLWKRHVHPIFAQRNQTLCLSLIIHTSCCQVLEKTNQFNADGDLLYKCRVYKHLNPAFDHPRIVNVFKTSNRWTKIELLSFARFEQKGLMCEIGETIIFMAILQTV